MGSKTIAVGNDHAGLALKLELRRSLEELGWSVRDVGCNSSESVDYPDFALEVCRRVTGGEAALGLLICGTGIGMCITANKVPGIRSTVCQEPYSAAMARAHNNANVLCLGGRVVGPELARAVVASFLETPFEGGRHQRRLDKIARLDGELAG